MVDGADHLYNSLTLMNDLLLAVLSDNGQFALYQHAVVHHRMVVPAQFLSGGEHILHCHQFGTSLQIIGQFYAVPTLVSTNQFGTHYLFGRISHMHLSIVLWSLLNLLLLTRSQYTCAANEGSNEHPIQHFLHHSFILLSVISSLYHRAKLVIFLQTTKHEHKKNVSDDVF